MVDYVDKIQFANGTWTCTVDKNVTEGAWTYKYLSLFSPGTFAKNQTLPYSLDDYLPKDDNAYEIMVSFIGNTSGTQSNPIYMWIGSGTAVNNFRCRTVGVINRTGTVSENQAQTVILPLAKGVRSICVHNENGATQSGNCYAFVSAYRRLGNISAGANDLSPIMNINHLSNASVLDKDYTVQFNQHTLKFHDTKNLPGRWIVKRVDLLTDYDVAASSTEESSIRYSLTNALKVDVSSCVPNDGYAYECIIDGTCWNNDSNDLYASLRMAFPRTSIMHVLSECCARGGSHGNYFNFRATVYPDNKVFLFKNTGNGKLRMNLRFEGYRRIGTTVYG